MASAYTSSDGFAADKVQRVFFLDSARALFMLLGIPFHGALIFGPAGSWILSDPVSSEALTWMAAGLHIFRMPGFFFIAGFFGALLIARRGATEWMSDRVVRLGVPFLTAALLLNPVQLWVEATSRPHGPDAVHAMAAVLANNPDRLLSHLWFLPALMVQCAMLAIAWRFGAALLRRLTRKLGEAAPLPFALLILALCFAGWEGAFALTLMLLPEAMTIWAAPLLDALAYLPWFALGAAAQLAPALLDRLSRVSPEALLAAAIAAPIHVWVFMHPDIAHAYGWTTLSEPIAALGLLTLILAALRRHADQHNALVAAIVAASFTIYLFHQPVILLLEYGMMGWSLTPLLKWALIVGITFPVCFFVHRLIARSHLLLFLFNGVRSRRERTLLRPAAS